MRWKILEKIKSNPKVVTNIDVSTNVANDIFDIKIKKINKVTIQYKNNERE